MFDLGWQEFILIALVAVIVVGPKDLPRVVRTVGQWIRKARSLASEFQGSLEEMADLAMPEPLQQLVIDELKVPRDDVFALEEMVGLADLSQLIVSERPDLLWTPFNARFPERIRDFDGDHFATIRTKDMLVHHPYESFDVVVKFVRQGGA